MKKPLISCLTLVIWLGLVAATAQAEAWLGDFAYRKRITINGLPSAGTGYQVRLRIGESSNPMDIVDEMKIKSLIKQLGDDDWKQREQSHQTLERIGVPAEAYLKEACQNPDPEIRLRATLLLRNIALIKTQVRGDIYLEHHCADFPNDIRFTDDDMVTELAHWLDFSYEPPETSSGSGTTPNRVATFWVKVTDNLDTNQSIYVYYGQAATKSASDGKATFLIYADFDTCSQDDGTEEGFTPAKPRWRVTESGTYMHQGGACWNVSVQDKSHAYQNFIARVKLSGTINGQGFAWAYDKDTGHYNILLRNVNTIGHGYGGTIHIGSYDGTGNDNFHACGKWYQKTGWWLPLELRTYVSDSEVHYIVRDLDPNTKETLLAKDSATDLYIKAGQLGCGMINNGNSWGGKDTHDDLMVRKIAVANPDADPTVSAVASEEVKR